MRESKYGSRIRLADIGAPETGAWVKSTTLPTIASHERFHASTITMIGCATMNNTFARSILRPLTRLLWACSLILTGVLSGGAAAQHLDNGILVLNYFPNTG